MAANTNNDSKNLRKTIFKALKATIKGIVFYVIYLVLWQFLAPVSEFVPGLQPMIETFVSVYIALIIFAELTSDTIFQHFLNTAKALFVIVYLMLSLKTGIFGLTLESMSVIVDVRLFLVIAMALSLLGLARSVLLAIQYVNEKTELTRI
jgi:hypothetical protein